LTALACLNAFWVIVSLVGISSINSRQSFRVTRFLVALFIVAISRIVFYVVMEIKMSDVPATSEWYCDAVYQGGLYIITAILEAVVIIIAIFLTWIIKSYIQCKCFWKGIVFLNQIFSLGRKSKKYSNWRNFWLYRIINQKFPLSFYI